MKLIEWICKGGLDMKPVAVVTTLSFALSGCGSSAPIQRVSDSQSNFGSVYKGETTIIRTDTSRATQYRAFSQGGTGFVSISAVRSDAESRANEFCKQENRVARTLSEQMSTPPYVLGNFPKMEIIFICVEKPDTTTEKNPGDKPSATDKLKELNSIHEQGLITDAEYQQKRKQILDGL